MKLVENTSSTSISVNQNTSITNEVKKLLLKLVIKEKKSIMQAANHVRISYKFAKRIIKKYRKNIIEKKSDKVENYNDKNQINIVKIMFDRLEFYESKLHTLINDIKKNQYILYILVNYVRLNCLWDKFVIKLAWVILISIYLYINE